MTEEINLIEVFKGIGSKFRHRWNKISLIILICLVLVVGLKFIWPERYDNHLIGQAKSLRIEVLAEVIKSLDEIIHEKNYSHLARILGIDEADARSIRKLELKEVYPEIFTHTTSENSFITIFYAIGFLPSLLIFTPFFKFSSFLILKKFRVSNNLVFLILSIAGATIWVSFNAILELPHSAGLYWLLFFVFWNQLMEETKYIQT